MRFSRKVVGLAGTLLTLGLAWTAACGKDDDSSNDAGAAHDGAAGDATNGANDGASGDGGPQTDGSALDGAAAGGCVGDRNLGVTETYPDSFFIQNGGRVYNVKSPPTSKQRPAAGNGMADDTGPLQDAWQFLKDEFAAHGNRNYAGGFVIYLPAGTYLVSDTIIYPGESLEPETGTDWIDVVDVRFAGESRETTTIQLKDHASGFDDPANPKIVLAFQHPGTRFNNIAGNNGLRNLTVDVGSGNPGAAGVFFQGANLTAMRNVLVKSDDGTGAYGFWFKIGSAQGDYHDLTVDGFSYGIFQNGSPTMTTSQGEVDTSFEHVTLTNQTVAAVGAGAGWSGRALCADETKTAAQGVKVQADGTQVLLIDSELKGAAADAGAIETTHTALQSVFLRNVATSGYRSTVVQAGAVVDAGPPLGEWTSLPGITLFDGGAPRSLALPIEEEPIVDWYDPATQWAIVDDYRQDGAADDTAAAQAALDSGKPVVVFPRASYTLKGKLMVPATVMRLDFLYADVGSPSVHVSEASTTPLLIERGGGYGGVYLDVSRPLVLHETGGGLVNSVTTPTKVYIENMVNGGAGDGFVPAGSTVWARAVNDENAAPAVNDIEVNGGTLWLFNYKTENKPVISLQVKPGSTVEVLNGYVNSTVDAGDTPMIVNDHSLVSYVGFTNLGQYAWRTTLEEIRDSGTAQLPQAAFPARDNHDIFIPLYSGDAR